MIKIYHRSAAPLCFIMLILGFGGLKAQNPVTNIDQLKDSFINGVTELYQEKIYIHTDRSIYITGETIWLKPYNVDATFHTLSDLSKIVNVELFDVTGKPVKQVRVQLNEGIGEGQLFVSPDIQTGTYVLRAYTNWMKNFSADFAFSKKITIINPSAVPIVTDDNQPEESNFIINFFPEGGDLVHGLESKVAVKTNDSFGRGISLTGVVFDNEENEVAKFSTSKNGFASFQLSPIAGKSYKARIALDSVVYKIDIPEARNSGLAMAVTTNNTGDYHVEVKATQDFLQTMYLVVHTRGVINKFEPLYPKVAQNIIIDNDGLASGITHVTILDSDFKPITERLLFKYPDNVRLLNASPNKKTFAKREKVTLTIESKQLDPSANISVAVFRSDSSLQLGNNIVSNLLLTSDLIGELPNAGNYFDEKNRDKEKELDLIMLTNGWRRFNWQQIANQKQPVLNFLAEMLAPIISGRLHKNANHSLNQSLQISFMGKASFLNTIDVDPEGDFYMEVPFRINNDRVLFFIDNDSLNKDQITLNSPFAFNYPVSQKVYPNIDYMLKEHVESLNANIQISQIYRKYNFINGLAIDNQNVTTGFYGTPDQVYLLDNYTRFETVEDLFIEYIRFAYIKTKNKKRKFYVLNEAESQVEAMVTIDGVPIFNSEDVLNFDPLKVEKISMVNNFYYLGDIGYSGLLNFTTYNGDFANQEFPGDIVELAYDAIQSPREFYSPNYAVNGDLLTRIPDFRNTLYWNPDFTINGNIQQLEFYASDDPGLYQIQIEGLTRDGTPFFSVNYFNIIDEIEP